MADLPSERLPPSPPYSYVRVDTFGPWSIVTRRTRGGVANSKRWALIFSCLTSRAIHLEVMEELSSASFINAVRRFISIRGPVKEFISDRGTNFIGATTDLGIGTINVEDSDISKVLLQYGTVCRFNPPYSSHFSGAWKRMIGLVRRVLDSMLCDIGRNQLTHDVSCTFMAEVTAIVNSRPITMVSTDPEVPIVLSPNVLLTQKVNCNITEPFGNLTTKDMYKSQWRYVQLLSNRFWKKWRNEYLQSLQKRTNLQQECYNVKKRDILLMIDSDAPKIEWPIGIIQEVYPSVDKLIRKVSIRVMRNGKPVVYTRPITQIVYLFLE